MITEITPSALLPTLEVARDNWDRLRELRGYMEDRQGFAPKDLMQLCWKAEDIFRSCLMRDTGSSDL